MVQMVPLKFAPDEDTGWSVNAGACKRLNGFAPLNRGSFGTVGSGAFIGTTGSISGNDVLHAQIFRKVSGSTRMLVFRKQNIDEYDSSATRTNQGTGYSASTASWTAAAFGDQIIAVNYLDAPQSSTGSTFGALAGSPPKARLVAANELHVMLADYDDGVTPYADGWFSSALLNPNSWTASVPNQCANGRIYSPPGPIRALVAWHNKSFLAFKDNSVHLLEYVGGELIYSQRTLSSSIGCHGPHAVTKLGDAVYFYHNSGFYSFDGSKFSDIGKPLINWFNQYIGYYGYADAYQTITAFDGPTKVQAVSDSLQNIVAFCATAYAGSLMYQWTAAFNTSTGRWAAWNNKSGIAGNGFVYVDATTADLFAFKGISAARLAYVNVGSSNSTCQYFGYPAATDAIVYEGTGPEIVTGMFGNADALQRLTRLHIRDASSTGTGVYSATVIGYAAERGITATSSETLVENTKTGTLDVNAAGKYFLLNVRVGGGDAAEISGLGPEFVKYPTGSR